jgi:hypothetical protein
MNVLPGRSNATTDQRMRLYAERMAVLRGVMQGCRSEDPGGRLAASQMTRRMTNISDDESPSYRMSTSQFCTTLHDAERAVTVGQQLVNTIGSASSSSHPAGGRAAASSTHVNAVADAMIACSVQRMQKKHQKVMLRWRLPVKEHEGMEIQNYAK